MAGRTVLLVLGVSLLLVQLVPSVRPFPLNDQDDKVTDTDLLGQDNTRMDTLNRILKNLMVEKRRFGCGHANCGRPCYKDDDGTVICGRSHYRRWR